MVIVSIVKIYTVPTAKISLRGRKICKQKLESWRGTFKQEYQVSIFTMVCFLAYCKWFQELLLNKRSRKTITYQTEQTKYGYFAF